MMQRIPPTTYMEDFEDQIFSGEDREFSSFAYRIAAIKNWGLMMRLPANVFPNENGIDRIQNSLSNWRLHLPDSKRDDVDGNGRLDEMMFQAHFIIHAYVPQKLPSLRAVIYQSGANLSALKRWISMLPALAAAVCPAFSSLSTNSRPPWLATDVLSIYTNR